jgi:hypothetical protein
MSLQESLAKAKRQRMTFCEMGNNHVIVAQLFPLWDLMIAIGEKLAEQRPTVDCLECGKPIDYRVGTCPHCGRVEFTERAL